VYSEFEIVCRFCIDLVGLLKVSENCEVSYNNTKYSYPSTKSSWHWWFHSRKQRNWSSNTI